MDNMTKSRTSRRIDGRKHFVCVCIDVSRAAGWAHQGVWWALSAGDCFPLALPPPCVDSHHTLSEVEENRSVSAIRINLSTVGVYSSMRGLTMKVKRVTMRSVTLMNRQQVVRAMRLSEWELPATGCREAITPFGWNSIQNRRRPILPVVGNGLLCSW